MNNSEFDTKARDWDDNLMRRERSEAIAGCLLDVIPVSSNMKALEYGAGTGMLSFLLAEYFSGITLMDSSREMVKVMQEKISASHHKNLKPLFFNLEKTEYSDGTFDLIFTQMVLHHVSEPAFLLNKFFHLLNPGGFLAIADLYTEDGSFHGAGFTGHKGFNVTELQKSLETIGFTFIFADRCFVIKKIIGTEMHEYPVFLLVASK